MESQLASTVLMIRPAAFETNPQTAASNRFQGKLQASAEQQHAAAVQEFDALVGALRDAGIEVIVVEDRVKPHTPDAIFPNNWISTHADGRVVLYPMEAPNRRAERRTDVIDLLVNSYGRRVTEVIDLSPHENSGHFLEGTGSMVLDRSNRIVYACLSTRTHLEPLADFAQRMGYDVVAFEAVDRGGVPIYHTNVLMNVGATIAVICDEAIVDDAKRAAVLARLEATGREVVRLTYPQLSAFAGNMLELRNAAGEHVIAMSRQAFDALDSAQIRRLRENGHIVSTPIDVIEKSAGGSVRCMLAEVHLPHSKA